MLHSDVLFVGTSHIASQSVKQVKEAFLTFKPDVVAIELDRGRLHALLTNQKPDYSLKAIKHVGFKGYLFAVIGGFLQRRLGKLVGMQPGADMKQAALLAKNASLPILLMDQEIQVTLRRLSDQMTGKEKRRLASDLLFGWAKRGPKVRIKLNEVPDGALIETLMGHLKERYPTFHRVLLEERNHYMAHRLARAVASAPGKRFLVVVGAGHLIGVRTAFEEAITTFLNPQPQDTHP